MVTSEICSSLHIPRNKINKTKPNKIQYLEDKMTGVLDTSISLSPFVGDEDTKLNAFLTVSSIPGVFPAIVVER